MYHNLPLPVFSFQSYAPIWLRPLLDCLINSALLQTITTALRRNTGTATGSNSPAVMIYKQTSSKDTSDILNCLLVHASLEANDFTSLFCVSILIRDLFVKSSSITELEDGIMSTDDVLVHVAVRFDSSA